MNKSKARFNWIDVAVILVILAVIGAAVYLILNGGAISATTNDTDVEYVVRISGVKEDIVPLISVGQTVKNSATSEFIGTVLSVRAEKSPVFGKKAIPTADGGYTIAVGEYEDLYDLYVTVRSSAATDSRGIRTVAGFRLLVGATVYFRVPSFASVSFITEVKPASGVLPANGNEPAV